MTSAFRRRFTINSFVYLLILLTEIVLCVKTTRRHLVTLSPLYKSLQSVSEKLRQCADVEAQRHVVDELTNVDRLRLDTDRQLTDQLQQLESTSHLWGELEAGMERIVEQLKNTMTSLAQPLSVNYDDLERELRHCQVPTAYKLNTCISVYI